MTYKSPEGGFSVPSPHGEELGDGRIWETRRITLQTSNQECSDGMSDTIYPQTVRAVVDGRELRGCGGATTAPPNDSHSNSLNCAPPEAGSGTRRLS